MSRLRTILARPGKWIGLLVLILACLGLGYALRAGSAPVHVDVTVAAAPETTEAVAQETVTVWTCSMHPQIQQPEPGLCPICSMPLIPVATGGEVGSMREFKTGEAALKLMEVQTSPVERRFVTAEVRMVGKIAYDETRLGYITAWIPGRLDRLFVDYTGIRVEKGDHMVYIYSPELLAAQEELIQALRAVEELSASGLDIMKETAQATVVAAREKLRLWGLAPDQIEETERRGTPSDHMTIYAPIGGIVIHKNALEGMYVKTGTRIYTIADLSHVWVKLDAYESDLMWLRYGQKVAITGEAYPGESFTGWIAFIDPVLDERTRTVKVRVNVPNPDGKLKPEMFVHSVVKARVAMGGRVMDPDLIGRWICPMHPEVVKDAAGACDLCGMPLVTAESLGYVAAVEEEEVRPLVIPVSAALVTGKRAIVYVEVPDQDQPTFEGREIVLGPRAGDYYIVRHGLDEGDMVVTRGAFKIDSALQIQAKPSMMTPEGGGAGGVHHHGAEPARAAPGQQASGAQVPAAFSEQVRRVVEAHASVAEAMETGDIGQVRAAFNALGAAVDSADGTLLSGHPRMLWKELSMLVKNDAVEGGDATDLKVARRVASVLDDHMRRVRAQFGAVHEEHAEVPLAEPVEVAEAFRGQIGEVFQGYLALQTALAEDDWDGALVAAGTMRDALDAVDMGLTRGDAHMAWMESLSGLQTALDEMGEAADIGALRAGFSGLSEKLAAVIRRFGIAPARPVYRLRCPMAFDGRSAWWLQADRDTRNPYFGAAMPECGEVVETISAEAPPAGGGHGHE